MINFLKLSFHFSLSKGDNYQSGTIETLQEELQNRNKRIDEILNEKNAAIDQCERQIHELQLNIQDREHKLVHLNDKLEQAEQKLDVKLFKFYF